MIIKFRTCLIAATCLFATLTHANLPDSVVAALSYANLPDSALRAVVVPLPSKITNPNALHLAHNADVPSVPASTQKLITTAIALDVLGADFKWQVGVYHTGVVAGGVLYGDLVLVGAGEPAFTHERLSALMGQISSKISHIQGNILIDTSRFGAVGYDPNAFDNQGDRAYNAEPSAFLVNFGTVEVKFVPSGQFVKNEQGEDEFIPSPNSLASVQLLPKLDSVTLPTTIATQNNCNLPKMTITSNQINLSGHFGANCGTQSLWRNFMNNDRLATDAVGTAWRGYDKEFSGVVVIGKKPDNAMPMLGLPAFVLYSNPLSEQITQINQFSNNVMTEQLALSLPLYADGRYGNTPRQSDYPTSFAFIHSWWQKNLKSAPPVMTRASGLCTDCFITPLSMSELLGHMYRHQAFVPFLKSLPIAGHSGTMKAMKNRSPNNPALGRAWIKTGTLKNVTSMAGYVKGMSGQDYAVVMMINGDNAGYSQKSVKVLDELLGVVASY